MRNTMRMTDYPAILNRVVAPFARAGHSPSGIVATQKPGEEPAIFTWGNEYTRTTPYRIASLTKSFTGLAMLILRREGQLVLDAPLATYLPEIRFDQPAHWPEPTVRHALSMATGLATDNPWGDRQESISRNELSEMMASGMRTIFPAGTGFEYSNLGYALLGEIITRISGEDYRDFVRANIIDPLGLTGTRFSASELPEVVQGWHREPAMPGVAGGWSEQEPSAPGAFSSIGGLFSCVNDLLKWAGMFVTGEVPTGVRFTAADLTEAQQIVNTVPPTGSSLYGKPETAGYGFGLRIQEVANVGRIISHAGGYPGFTCLMVWHEETKQIVLSSANGTHAGAPGLAYQVMHALLSEKRTKPAVQAWPELRKRATDMAAFVRSAVAGKEPDASAFAMNADLDIPLTRRAAFLADAATMLGKLAEPTPIAAEAPCRGTFHIPAEFGTLRVFLELEPLAPYGVQTFHATLISGVKEMRLF